jgi:hypothetical protein
VINDDIGGLFAPPPDGPAQPAVFRQAMLVEFNPDDGSNTVGIGPARLTNLPMLVTGAEIGLEAGDNILVMYLGNTPMIVGKITSVGGPNYGASAVGRVSDVANGHIFGLPATGLCSLSFTAPLWANSMVVMAFGGVSLHNNSGGLSNLFAQVEVTTPLGVGLGTGFNTAVPDTFIGSALSQYINVNSTLPGGVTTVVVNAGGGIWPTDSGANAQLDVNIQYFREAVS